MLSCFIATSLDGYVARRDGGIDWLFHDGDDGYAQFVAGVDAAPGGDPYGGKPVVVFTRGAPLARVNERVTFTADAPPAWSSRARQASCGSSWAPRARRRGSCATRRRGRAGSCSS